MSLAPSRPASTGRLVLAAVALAFASTASAQDVQIGRLQQARLAAAFDAGDLTQVSWNADRDTPQFLAGDLGRLAPTAAPTFFAVHANLFGFADEDPEVQVLQADTDDLGLTHVRVQQTVGGVPVWGAESALHLARDGQVYAWGGDLHPEAEAAEPGRAALSASGAIAAAERALGPVTYRASVPGDALADPIDWSPDAELVVFPHDGLYPLAYHVTLYVDAPVPANWEVFVDATSGVVLDRFNSLHTAGEHAETAAPRAIRARQATSFLLVDGPTTGTGTSTFGGTLSLPTYLSGGSYYLYDATRGPQYIRTMTANKGTGLPGSYVTDSNNAFTASNQRAAVDAHYGAVKTFDYYKNTHGRSSYNGNNATITSTVNYSSGYNNAFWNGQQMVYGDGDGSLFIPLVALDIAAHELSHAVTGSSAKLIYQGESGALNEAFSDIMAVMVDRDDYKIGENSYTPGTSGDALRYLDDPKRGNQPDNYADRYTGSKDNGGVHTNSGIANKQAYLMIAGGTFRGVTVQSVGRGVTEKVWYRAMTKYFTQSTNFSGARQGTLQAAADLYGSTSTQYKSVANAWAAVGVGSSTSAAGEDVAGSDDGIATLGGSGVAELELAVGPNPTRASATATVSLPEAGPVRVAVVDLLGREVASAYSGQMEAGRQPVALSMDALPAGVYVVVVDAGGQRLTRQVTVIR